MGKRRPDGILPQLVYWKPDLLRGEFSATNAHRYISFDVDQGGLNNIRLVLEYVAVIAAITGRTLVLPPGKPWYLLNNGPKHKGIHEGVTRFRDLFEVSALKQILPILNTEEFVLEAAEHLGIPDRFQQEQAFDTEGGTPGLLREWKRWLLDHGEVLHDWNPYATLICYPDIESACVDRLSAEYVDGRRPVEFTPWVNACPLIHFPSNSECRYLGPVAAMLASADDNIPQLGRRLIKHHVRYRDEIFALASRLVSNLGLYRYSALHIRRNDFQYSQTRTRAEETWDNMKHLISDGTPVYIATDEVDQDFREFFKSKASVLFWEDISVQLADEDFPEKYIGPVEQIICACATRFIGTDLSTFSAYIVRLRGYISAPDTASYYHTEYYPGPKPEPHTGGFRGRDYLRENPLYWMDC